MVSTSERMKHRSRTEIIDSMLRSIRAGTKKTHIMYEAYISFAQLKEYLRVLEERELISFEEDSGLYRITNRGLRYMNAYDEISELISGTLERGMLPYRTEVAPVLSPKLSELYNP
jgi:predicted transcriptional regulator